MATPFTEQPPPLLDASIARFDTGGHPTIAQVQYEQRLQQYLKRFVTALSPLILPSYTVAQLNGGVVLPATTYPGGVVFVSNGTGNKRLAISDGTIWRFPDGAAVT